MDATIAATNRAGSQILLLNRRDATVDPAGIRRRSRCSILVPRDSKYVYYQETLAPDQPIFRATIGSTKKEKMQRVMSSRQIPQSNSIGYLLAGLAPDDSPIATVIYTNSDIYALDVDLP
jgi:hypothetical protein